MRSFPPIENKTILGRHNYLSLAGTSDTAIPFFLNKQNLIKEMVFCLDNDPAGREAAVSMARKYADKGFYTRLELPAKKDFNEDLKAYRASLRNDNAKSDVCL